MIGLQSGDYQVDIMAWAIDSTAKGDQFAVRDLWCSKKDLCGHVYITTHVWRR